MSKSVLHPGEWPRIVESVSEAIETRDFEDAGRTIADRLHNAWAEWTSNRLPQPSTSATTLSPVLIPSAAS
jgi:hypothetical protein